MNQRISSEDLQATIEHMEKQGYILGETFGFELSPVDAPSDSSFLTSSTEPASRMWYKVVQPNGTTETMRPWLGSLIKDVVKGNYKLTVDFEAKLPVEGEVYPDSL